MKVIFEEQDLIKEPINANVEKNVNREEQIHFI